MLFVPNLMLDDKNGKRKKNQTEVSKKVNRIHFGVRAGSPTSTLPLVSCEVTSKSRNIDETTSFFASDPLKPFCPKMSSPSLEERTSDWREQEETRSAVLHLSQCSTVLPAFAPVLCYATDKMPPPREWTPSDKGEESSPGCWAESWRWATAHPGNKRQNATLWRFREGSLSAFGGNHGRKKEKKATCLSAAPDPACAHAARRLFPGPSARPSPRSQRAGSGPGS